MCNRACLQFAAAHLTTEDVAGCRVLEVGARDVNGSVRLLLEDLAPSKYIGVDIEAGPGVDQVCDIGELVATFGAERFDVVVCTEVLEHVRDWRGALSNLKHVLVSGGTLLVTTRSIGFRYHGYPYDFWRYEPDDVDVLLGDMTIRAVERDPIAPGIFVKAMKPSRFEEVDLVEYRLHSVITGRRCRDVTDGEIRWFLRVKRPMTRFFRRMAKSIRKRLPRRVVDE